MKRLILGMAAAALTGLTIQAQRQMDSLDRGLVAMKTDAGIYCSWRINANEWDNTLYNIYRGGTKLNDAPLKVSNFTDPSGSLDATYTVKAVVNGVESDACSPVKPWEKNYTIIKPQHAPEITMALTPNDATVADVDGDGQLEIIVKYDPNFSNYSKGDNGIFTVIECLKMDGTVLWWINCGPNMGDFQNNEINIAAYDWDGDGKAEVVFRAADGTQIHQADGTNYTVGDGSVNYRSGDEFPSGQWFMRWGKEYLIYANGETGQPYDDIEYPLKRVEDENNPNGLLSGSSYDNLISSEWGDGYGHRSSKYFFAAPYLDGMHPSIFLARGIYTKHKMITYDVDPATHKLVERWRWNDLGGDWYGQGYHNMGIADVDMDGRDEIVYGSMVIDDNGRGLSTSGLGHGDSQHCGDFDPYSHGLEIFACNEDNPNNNFRDATTSKIYYRTTGGTDDGRANCGNFIDEYPGSEGISSRDDNLIGGASHKGIIGDSKATVSITQNFRVFWDGDLCDESFDYNNGKNSRGTIFKPRLGQIAILEGSLTNNDTKGTPCLQGDILGDWREEYIMRDGDNNIRIYTTDIPTEHRIYSLWYDHQYRNAMVWQMGGYNQTPHVSFALSEFEDITVPPAPLSMTGRIGIENGGTIDASLNGKSVVVYGNGDVTVAASDGAAPAVLTVNAPTWVQGHNDNNNITTTTYTHTIKDGHFRGEMKLVKQGDGRLVMPTGTHTYSGNTEVWAGTLALDGELSNSQVWLNRFGKLETNGLNLPIGLDMNYASELMLGNDTQAGSLTTGELTFGFGAIINLDLFADQTSDRVNASKLTIETKDWVNGPEYLQPIVKFTTRAESLPEGKYLIGEIGEIEGSLDDIIMLGMENMKKSLVYEDGKLYLELKAYVPGDKTWTGDGNALWNLDGSASFANTDNTSDVFVPGDNVIFDDTAANTNVTIEGRLQPASVTFRNDTKDYTLSGDGQIVGETSLVKEGAGTLTINNINSYTGNTYLYGGKLIAGVFANNIGTELGALSDVGGRIYMSNDATLAVSQTATLGQSIYMEGKANVDVPGGLSMTLGRVVSTTGMGQIFTKTGSGTLNLSSSNGGMSRLVIDGGSVYATEANDVHAYPTTVEFVNGSLYDPENIYSYSTNNMNIFVDEDNKGNWYLDSRCNYKGKLTGKGKLTVFASGVRNYLQGNWSEFEGELTASAMKRGTYDPDFTWDNSYGMPKATLNISSNVAFNAQSKNVKLGSLKGSGTYKGSGTLTVGNDDTTITFTGTFSDNTKVTKTGKCDWNLTKQITGYGSLTATDGTISLSASKAPYNTTFLTKAITIKGDAKLRGRGTVADITATDGGIIEPGSYSDSNAHHYGPIFSTGNVTIENDATLSLYLRDAGKGNDRSYLDVKGTLKIDGKIEIAMNPEYEPKTGDEFQMWTAGSFSGEPTIELPQLPEGLAWDTNGLQDGSGWLRVTDGTAVGEIDADMEAECRIYSLSGMLVKSMICKVSEAMDMVRTLDKGTYILRYADKAIKLQN